MWIDCGAQNVQEPCEALVIEIEFKVGVAPQHNMPKPTHSPKELLMPVRAIVMVDNVQSKLSIRPVSVHVLCINRRKACVSRVHVRVSLLGYLHVP